jgi:hypothetical protein
MTQIHLVLVHLGTSRPNHLWKNIAYLKKQWPEIALTLIGDQPVTKKKSNSLGVAYFEYKPSEAETELVFSTNHDSSFRKGFWNYSLLRLFAVIKFAETNDKGVVLHIESDVLLMKNFPFDVFRELTKPAWLRFNESHDVASIFAVPNKLTASWLREKLSELLTENKNFTDMTLLSQISHEDPQRVEMLPIARNENDPILKRSEMSKNELLKITENYDKYGGVFDSAPIGMWLLGQDPRNHKGKLKRFINLSNSFIQPSQVKLQAVKKEAIITYNQGIPIFDLHVHSKEIKYFTRMKSLYFSTESSKNLIKAEKFLPLTFFHITLDYFARKGLINGITSGIKRVTNKN